jgi:hypothetical protein
MRRYWEDAIFMTLSRGIRVGRRQPNILYNYKRAKPQPNRNKFNSELNDIPSTRPGSAP